MAEKIRLGDALTDRIRSEMAIPADFWALGRIGARHLLYGSIVNVVPSKQCERWIDKILDVPCKDEENLLFTLEQLARKTEHRELNLEPVIIEKILKKFEQSAHINRLKELLLKECRLTEREQEMMFGERLPAGLLLESL